MPNTTVVEAMAALHRAENAPMCRVFFNVLEARSKQAEPDCALFARLAANDVVLQRLNKDCGAYLRELGDGEAVKKCNSALIGDVGRSGREFNGVCGDFWTEMAAVRALAELGFGMFRAIHTMEPDGTTSDYEAFKDGKPSHIETKNIRRIDTVFDVFDREIRRLYARAPTEYPFRMEVNFPFDDLPSNQEKNEIAKFVASLAGRKPPFRDSLELASGQVRIYVSEGVGDAFGRRGITLESPESLNEQRFLQKVHDLAGRASNQMRDRTRLRVLVINYESPSGMIPEDFIRKATQNIEAEFNGELELHILLYRELVLADSD